MIIRDITVIGGGVSGLTFAHYASLKGCQVKVFEKEMGGGCIHSHPVNKHHIDFGAHTLTNRYATVLEILEHYEATDQIDKPLPLKFEGYVNNMFSSLLSRIHWMEMLRSVLIGFKTKKTGLSVSSYYSKIFGKRNYHHFFHYVFQAILCQDPDHYPAEQLFRKRERNGKYPKAFSLKKGVAQLLTIIQTNPSISLEYKNITKITREGDLYVLWSSAEKVAVSKFICLACDPRNAALMIEELQPAIAVLMQRFPVVQIQSLLIGSSNTQIFSKRSKSLIGFDMPFYSAILYVIEGAKFWLFHFRENEKSVIEKVRLISEVFSVREDEIYVVAARPSLLPAVSAEHVELQREIDLEIVGSPIFIAGNYLNGLSVEDCCSRAKNEAERLMSSL